MDNETNHQTISQEPTSGSSQPGKSSNSSTIKNRMYPELIIPNNTHPNKLYAFPLVGLIIKIIMLIPVFIVSTFIGFIAVITWIITPFTILFNGKYWDNGYIWT